MQKRDYPVYAFLILTCVLVTSFGAFAESVPRMTVDELKSRLGADDVVVLDVRSSRDWNASDTSITGAVRVSPNDVSQWAGDFPNQKTFVLYCT